MPLIASRHGGLQWYVIMYCAAAPYGCPTVIKIGGRYAGIASPNSDQLNAQEYSNVYNVETSGTKLSKNNTGAVVPLAEHICFQQLSAYTCAETHEEAGKTMGFKDSFQPSRILVGDAQQLQLQQNSKDGLLHATQAVAALRLRPHTQGLTLGPAVSSANKLSTWQTASKGEVHGSIQSQAVSMLDFKPKIERKTRIRKTRM